MTTTTQTTTLQDWCRDCGEDAEPTTLDLDGNCPACTQSRRAADGDGDFWDAVDEAWGRHKEDW